MNGMNPPYGFLADRYELAMAWAYWRDGRAREPVVFDYFFRKLPCESGYALAAGFPVLAELLEEFAYDDGQLAHLEQDGFAADFLEALRTFRFQGSVQAMVEGEVVFPLEPVLRVEGGLMEAQLVETLVLNVLNFQTLIATKAARCRQAAGGRGLSEFGLRRAQGMGGHWASRAACVGGFDTTSNLAAALAFGLRASGTMAHSYIQSYPSELAAFRRYAAVHGSNTILLLDTYDTLASGLPNALQVAGELKARGESLAGVRLDSGDLAYLARRVRSELDAAGFNEVRIVASNQLDEHVIRSLVSQEAPIDLFGLGTSIAVGQPDGALDGIYKLAQVGETPCLKLSENPAKTSLPGRKQVTRYRDEDGRFVADAIHTADESEMRRMIHPFAPAKQLDLTHLTGETLLHPLMEKGRRVLPAVSISKSADHARRRLRHLPDEHRRFENPHVYKVGLSEKLHALREKLITQYRNRLQR